jgi:hypothetical protein
MDEITGRVLAAGCDDAFLAARGSTFSLTFDREAGSLAEAVASAIAAIERAEHGPVAVRVAPPSPEGRPRSPLPLHLEAWQPPVEYVVGYLAQR